MQHAQTAQEKSLSAASIHLKLKFQAYSTAQILGRVPNLKKSLYLIKYTSYFLKYEVYS